LAFPPHLPPSATHARPLTHSPKHLAPGFLFAHSSILRAVKGCLGYLGLLPQDRFAHVCLYRKICKLVLRTLSRS
ncbi:hypothetical protein DFH06DRAFT_1466019, partial [Mycena polygramma]